MDMVRNPTNQQGMSFLVFTNSRHIGMQFRPGIVLFEKWETVFSGKNKVD
jgi:hypothetical protein